MTVCTRCKLPTIPGFDYCPHCHNKLEKKMTCEKCLRHIKQTGQRTVCIFCGNVNIKK